MSTLRVNVKVRKYLWNEIVHDVAFVLYATIMISDALSKRFFNRPIGQTLSIVFFPVIWLYNFAEKILKYSLLAVVLLLAGGLALFFTVGIPIVLILAALGKIN